MSGEQLPVADVPETRADGSDGNPRSLMSLLSQASGYPGPPGEAAFHGPIGEVVRLLEPHTESDPAALLVQSLVAFGNAIGRGPHRMVAASRHYPNMFAVVAGKTSKSRKGASWNQVKGIMGRVADDRWVKAIRDGLSTGEGLIHAVRDRATLTTTGQPDSGVEDKRLLIVQGEFAQVLKVMARDGNTLGPLLRNAWDTGDLASLTKNNPLVATGAHISIIAHITEADLRRHLTSTDAANGFANRFLWVCARRIRLLPDGGNLDEAVLATQVARLRDAIQWAGALGEARLDWDSAARERWQKVYFELSQEPPGLVGAITSRGEAQIVRLALIYALMDCSLEIRLSHLEAGIAVWRYCEASATFIFGGSVGDPLADEILQGLQQAGQKGMKRTDIRDTLGRHTRASEIEQALGTLHSLGLARRVQEKTAGRAAERWFAEDATEATKATNVGVGS